VGLGHETIISASQGFMLVSSCSTHDASMHSSAEDPHSETAALTTAQNTHGVWAGPRSKESVPKKPQDLGMPLRAFRCGNPLERMYGPPSDCKEKLRARIQVCANVFGLYWSIARSWPG